MPTDDDDRLLTPGEVAHLFRVDPKTVTRWSKAGKLARVRTPGGHGRYRESEIRALLEADGADSPDELIAAARRPTRAGTATTRPATAAAVQVPAVRNNRGW